MEGMRSYFKTKFVDLKIRNFTSKFIFNEKYDVNKNLY